MRYLCLVALTTALTPPPTPRALRPGDDPWAPLWEREDWGAVPLVRQLEDDDGWRAARTSFARFADERYARDARAVLATTGGGPFIVTSEGGSSLKTLEKVFLVDLEPDFQGREIPFGTRAHVRVSHGSEALASQWYRRLRQVFLRQFNV